MKELINKIENITLDELNFEKNIIYNQDCILGMKLLPDNIANIIIADPPYNIGKDFGNQSDKQEMSKYLKWCEEWISECLRLLKIDGTLYIYGFSEILAYIRVLLEPIGEPSKCNVKWVIWHYTNKVVPSLNFWQKSHESILVCYKDKTKIFNKDDVREEYSQTFLNNSVGKIRTNTKGRFNTGLKDKKTIYKAHEKGALPRDVIKISALSGGAGKNERVNHPTQKPLKICEKLLTASINKNELENLLIVPFCGSGSECLAAKKMGIKYISFELNKDYIQIAKDRLKNC